MFSLDKFMDRGPLEQRGRKAYNKEIIPKLDNKLLLGYYVVSTIVWAVYGSISSLVLLISIILIGIAPFSTVASIMGLWLAIGVIGAIVIGNLIELKIGRSYNPVHWKLHLALDNILYFGTLIVSLLGLML